MVKFGTSLMMMAAMLLLSVGIHAGQAQYGEAVKGSAKADKLDACVAPTPYMRRSHFELIKHQRDITVHEGIRKTDNSLAGCVDCHANQDAHGNFVPVNEEKQFCAGCHEYTGVMFDCFSCHATTPTKTGN
jgi:predicted CXXCH cytochrome family protein